MTFMYMYRVRLQDWTQEMEQRAQWSAPAWAACCALCSISCVQSWRRTRYIVGPLSENPTLVLKSKDLRRPHNNSPFLSRIAHTHSIPLKFIAALLAKSTRQTLDQNFFAIACQEVSVPVSSFSSFWQSLGNVALRVDNCPTFLP